jgi:3'(2'), 5'-bisphosphate nucleotidase
MHTHTTKVFGIGLSKTGTTSLARALEILGYKTRDFLGVTSYIAGDLSSIDLREIDENDAFTDTPIPSFYKQLDEKYPNSKFILTTRNMDDWLRSCKKQFTKRMVERQNEATTQLHTDLYDCFEFDAEKYTNGYTRFVEDALDYFSNRREDLLVTDICGGADWEELCSFLGKPIPDVPFPVANVSAIQWMDIQKIVSIAKQAGHEINNIYESDSRPRQAGSKQGVAHWLRNGTSSMLAKLFKAGYQGHNRRLQKASRKSLKSILNGLKKMNPAIPVISPASANIPFAARRNWSHVWLINPLDGEDAFLNHTGDFTVNIALIEGGKPVWGVVYSPRDDTVYYAKGANGSFMIHGDNLPEELVMAELAHDRESTVVISSNTGISEDDEDFIRTKVKDYKFISTERVPAFRMLLEGKAAMHINTGPTMEWETAAAHAIARAAGKQAHVYNDSEPLSYNKESLINESFVIE